jgi:hypothetical protein
MADKTPSTPKDKKYATQEDPARVLFDKFAQVSVAVDTSKNPSVLVFSGVTNNGVPYYKIGIDGDWIELESPNYQEN